MANIGDKDDNETIFGADKWSSGLNSYIDTCMHIRSNIHASPPTHEEEKDLGVPLVS